MDTSHLFERYYFSRPDFVDGTTQFHRMCEARAFPGCRILEVGSGPANQTSTFLSGLGEVTGLDVSDELFDNPALSHAHRFDGERMPLPDDTFDLCVSNYVIEHIPNPSMHFAEIARVLKVGGAYVFRTPNIFHYVALVARVLPHSAHLRIANPLRALPADAHDPYPTTYRANSSSAIRALAARSGLHVEECVLVEKQPSYGSAHPLLFFPMMLYERLVNASPLLAELRSNLFVALTKPRVD